MTSSPGEPVAVDGELPGDATGCGCRVGRESSGSRSLALLGALGLLALRARRRRHGRIGEIDDSTTVPRSRPHEAITRLHLQRHPGPQRYAYTLDSAGEVEALALPRGIKVVSRAMRPSKPKNGAKPAGRGPEILRVLAVGPGVVQNLESISAAFEALTGVTLGPGDSPTPEQWNAYLLMQQAVLAVVDPSPEHASWVEQALLPFTTSHDASLCLVMEEIVRLAQADEGRLVGERLTIRAYGRPKVEPGAGGRKITYEATGADAVRTSLARADGAFAQLTDEMIKKELGRKWEGQRAAPTVAARLALAVGAFGCVRRSTEAREVAVDRVAKEFRLAESRFKKSHGTRSRKGAAKADPATNA